jgi:peptide/nickel transport system substrate-binding protein
MGIRITRAPTYSGPAIYFNQDIYPFSRPEVRQAVAYAVNRDENGKVSLGESGKAPKYLTGFSDNMLNLWLSKEQMDKLIKSTTTTRQKAEEILTKIGFKKGQRRHLAG